jgi:hypothetical protein
MVLLLGNAFSRMVRHPVCVKHSKTTAIKDISFLPVPANLQSFMLTLALIFFHWLI